MSDVREAIFVRLKAICRAINGVSGAYRNGVNLSETRLPCMVVHDGDESGNDSDPMRQSIAPRRMTIDQTITIAIAAEPENTGTQLNAFRAKLLTAILEDEQLKALTGNDPRGGVRYEGCTTELTQGQTIIALMNVSFTVPYIFRVSDL